MNSKLFSIHLKIQKIFLFLLLGIGFFGFSQNESIVSSVNNCQGKTFTQGGWGATNMTPWQVNYLYNNFDQAFPDGLSIGCNTGFSLKLTSAQAVTDFLPSGGTPSALNQDYTNPGSSYTNTLAGQLVSVTLAVVFDAYDANFSSSNITLGDFIITSGAFQGYSVNQFLQSANNFLGGCGTAKSSTTEFSASDYNATATAINENFDGGSIDNGFLSCCILKAYATFEPIKCFGGTTVVHVTATGGSVNTTGTGDFEVGAGTYTYTVKDGNCESSVTITVTQPEKLTTNIEFTPILCNGGQSTVTVTASGGTPPYTGTGSFSVSAGTYTYTVTDANGCSDTATVTITQPEALALSISGGDVMCYGGKTTLTANVSGGTSPYSYLWSTGETTPNISVGVGNYSVTVTDANGCSISASFAVKQQTCNGFTTVTQGGWGAKAAGNNWGTYRDKNFATAFPTGLTVGAGTRFLRLTTAKAVDDFLPSGTTARALNAGTLTNPGSNYQNVLAGQVVALSLSVRFDEYDANFSTNTTKLGDLIVVSGTFAGWSVYQVLAEANNVLGGVASMYSAAQLNAVVDSINNNYDGGKVNLGFLACPCNVPKPAPLQARTTSSNKVIPENVSSEITLYPNPSPGEINLRFEVPNDGKVLINIYDAQGKLVGDYSNRISKSGKQGSLNISNSNLSNGLYLVKVKTSTTEKTFKLIIRK